MKILVADDDPIIRMVLVNLLQKWEYEPVAVANGLEGPYLHQRGSRSGWLFLIG